MNPTLEEQLVTRLIEKNWHISCAESCTGGLVAATLVNVANASKVFDVSFVTYANEAKIKYLDVSAETIGRYGVVSEPVTKEMAIGVVKAAASETGIAISGIAGPGGGTTEKPVGMVCFGFNVNGAITTETVYFPPNGRNEVRKAAAEHALKRMLELL